MYASVSLPYIQNSDDPTAEGPSWRLLELHICLRIGSDPFVVPERSKGLEHQCDELVFRSQPGVRYQ
jgi:hypothetical protein